MRTIDADALEREHCADCNEYAREICKHDPICATMMWVRESPTLDYAPTQQWISAKDRLPKHEENVLLYFGKFMGVGYRDEADQSFYDAADDYELVNVTHWMPLPEAPKEDADD